MSILFLFFIIFFLYYTAERVATFAGKGDQGDADGNGIAALFNFPCGLCMNPYDRCLYVCDSNNYRIKKVTMQGRCLILFFPLPSLSPPSLLPLPSLRLPSSFSLLPSPFSLPPSPFPLLPSPFPLPLPPSPSPLPLLIYFRRCEDYS